METIFCWSKSIAEDRIDEWETRLLLAEVPHVLDKETKRKRWRVRSYATSEGDAEELRRRYGGTVTALCPEDWQPKAQVGLGTLLKIRDSLLVTETEDAASLAELKSLYPRRTILRFPPQLAFGTGGHPTTAGCLRFLADFAAKRPEGGWRVLDLGCGSGILGIAAAKLGAASVVAVENDGMALDYARRNARRHGVASKMEFVEGDAVALMKARGPSFDLIAANLFSDLLEELFPWFSRHLESGGEIIVSGFLGSQAPGVTSIASASGLPLRDFLRRGKWLAARGSREKPPVA